MSVSLVKPRAARRAAIRPFCAALPACSGLDIVPNTLFQTRRLGAGQTEGVAGLLGVQPHQLGGGGHGAEGPEGCGGLPALGVVGRSKQPAHAALGLDPGDKGQQRFAAGRALGFGEADGDRRHRHGRMAVHGGDDVVKVQGVRQVAVDQHRIVQPGGGASRPTMVRLALGRRTRPAGSAPGARRARRRRRPASRAGIAWRLVAASDVTSLQVRSVRRAASAAAVVEAGFPRRSRWWKLGPWVGS